MSFLIFKTLSVWNFTVLFSADAGYFYSGGLPIGINHEIIFFIILGIFCGMIGSAYVQFQRYINSTKSYLAKYDYFKNNWIYSLSMCFIIVTSIFYTRFMLASDRAIIGSMINID